LLASNLCGRAAAQDQVQEPSGEPSQAANMTQPAAQPGTSDSGPVSGPEPDSVTGAFSLASAAPTDFAPPVFPEPRRALNHTSPNTMDLCDLLSRSGLKACLSNILHDQRGIWTAPLHAHRSDAIWIVPLAGVTAMAFAEDNRALAAASTSPNSVHAGNYFSDIASGYTLGGAVAGMYVIGKITHNENVRETSMVALEALLDAEIVTESLKFTTNRIRPGEGPASGNFWADGRPPGGGETEIYTTNGSFPSGHTTAAFAMAHVLVDETPGHRWLHIGLWTLATGVGAARVIGRDHFPSDVVVGGALGYLVGGYVYRQRSQFYQKGLKTVSLSPIYNATTRTYGMGVSLVP
jgi:membrane-associated phospholipid phosphatase